MLTLSLSWTRNKRREGQKSLKFIANCYSEGGRFFLPLCSASRSLAKIMWILSAVLIFRVWLALKAILAMEQILGLVCCLVRPGARAASG